MKYSLFLFDLDDTLLDFRASERLSFARIVAGSVDAARVEAVFADYQAINHQLWVDFEQGRVSKDVLKVERFRRVFSAHAIDADPVAASHAYLEC
ncbi:MAG: hypothetical protein BGO98_08185 [Myxococcales bacterium 68-20]|mgnify:CR=1 FL=1|nr:MAG: hypothetical protein BGO98_08185 [Myxococcales bacterium 68-20]